MTSMPLERNHPWKSIKMSCMHKSSRRSKVRAPHLKRRTRASLRLRSEIRKM